MIHILCPAPSESAGVLVKAIKEVGGDARRARRNLPLSPGDKVVCWGRPAGHLEADGVVLYNNVRAINKLAELQEMQSRGIPVPLFTVPGPVQPPDLVENWIPRRLNHQDSEDFRNPPTAPAFWTQRIQFVEEWRFHIFHGRSLRAARKERLGDGTFHYSYRMGPPTLRKVAIQAVRALGLDFGAADVALTTAGTAVVFEVNRRPGLDPNGRTAHRYAAAFMEG
jgi:hypothetical protein